MATVICDNCGTKNFENAKNCRSCLKDLRIRDEMVKSDESIFLQTEYNLPIGYQVPEDYVETSSYWQRLRGLIWERDLHVVKEIQRRKELQKEATYSLLAVISLMSIVTIIDWNLDPAFNLNTTKKQIGPIVYIFALGYVTVYLVVYLSRVITNKTFTEERNAVFRPFAYVYTMRLIDSFVHLIYIITESNVVYLFYLITVIYEIVLFSKIIGRSLDASTTVGLLSILLSFLTAVYVADIVFLGYEVLWDLIF